MKKAMISLLCISMLAVFLGCKEAPAAETQPESLGTTTLMIYMVGSDLEAKGGAATDDLQEMLESQADLTGCNVLVYAGGAKKWHNDLVLAENGHTILQLTAQGFETLQTREDVSMGEAQTLSYFLDYAYNNHPADRYALILWDHGSGPLIGYGKDILHKNDTLTLPEMQQALEASVFVGENKLDWVGFDACLMSSVELACILQNHARYMIASQEVEPAFGWDYHFLKYLGKVDAQTLGKEITGMYMESCLAYYAQRGYDQRDTTLSVMDLSKTAAVQTALDALFAKAGTEVQNAYSELVATRVDARALGRATTGSEYDLIDLADLAEKMQDRYPAEAQAVLDATKALVVHNATNAEGCCGVSFYYPFYNKSYYEKSWGQTYQQLGVLPAYSDYLQAYATKWLQKDLMTNVASSTMPKMKSDSEFVLNLTPQQAEHFADANYYILQQEGDQIYTRIYTSSDVTKQGQVLIANFDGDILYAKNNLGDYWIPAVEEHDTVGEYTRYSTYVNLTNSLPLYGERPAGYQQKTEGHRFHISVNNATKQIKTSALVPYATTVQTDVLVGGKQEDADLSQWSQYYFLQERHLYLRRDENGTILPLSQWEKSSYLSANVSRVDDGVEFLFAPIPDGAYYLMFEVVDVQGNRYCSELLPIQSQGAVFPEVVGEEPVNVRWATGAQVELFSKEGITACLTTVEKYGKTKFALMIENNNDFDVAVLGHEIMFNNWVYCPDGSFGYFSVPAGQSAVDDGFAFGDAADLGALKDLQSIQFSFSVVTGTGDRTLINEKVVSVEMAEEIAAMGRESGDLLFNKTYYSTDAAAFGMQAETQTVFSRDGLQMILMGMGGNGDDSRLVLNFRIENTSAVNQTFRIDGLALDGVFINQATGPITLAPNTCIYRNYVLLNSDLEMHGITSASSAKLWVAHMEFATLMGGGGFSESVAYEVTLTKRGQKAHGLQNGSLLYQDEQVMIYLHSAQERPYGGYEWILSMVNKGQENLLLSAGKVTVNGVQVDMDSIAAPVLAPYTERCPGGQMTVFDVSYLEDAAGTLRLTIQPQFYDFNGEQLLYSGTEIVLNK